MAGFAADFAMFQVCLDACLMLAVQAQQEMSELEGKAIAGAGRAGGAVLKEVSCFCASSEGPSLVVTGPAGRGVEGGMAVTKSRPFFTKYHNVVGQWVVKCSSVEEEILQWSWTSKQRTDSDGKEDARNSVVVTWSLASDSLVDSLWIYMSILFGMCSS